MLSSVILIYNSYSMYLQTNIKTVKSVYHNDISAFSILRQNVLKSGYCKIIIKKRKRRIKWNDF